MKGISIDTFRPGKINISSFLTILIFCCLLFMEFETVEEEAYERLRTNLGKLLGKLRDLQYDINKRAIIITGAIDDQIDGQIDRLIKTVDSTYKNLGDRVPKKKIKKDIDISSQVSEALGYLSRFFPRSSHDSGIVLAKIGKTWEIWENQIQMKVDEAIASASQ